MTNNKITIPTPSYIEDSLMYNIDSYCGSAPQGNTIDVIGYHDSIVINGWIFLLNEKKTLKNVYLRINESLFKAIYHLSRKDVSGHFNTPSVDNCGFNLEIETCLIPKLCYNFEIIGEDYSGRWHISQNYSVQTIIQRLFTPSGNENLNELYHVIKQKENEVSLLQEVIHTKNKQIFKIYNSKTWKLNKTVFSALNYFKSSKSLPQNIVLGHEPFYNEYLKKRQITPFALEQYKVEMSNWGIRPKMSIITPVYNVDPALLDKCIQSVLTQIYSNWELCLYDDASTNKQTLKRLKYWAKKDQRIKVEFGKANGHISHASNCAIAISTGEFICLLDNDDELTPDALFEVCKAINVRPDLDFIYSDEDKLREDGTYLDPYFKSDFNIDLLLSNNYICHFTTIRRSLGDSVGWFRKGYEGAQDHDLFLRVIEKTNNIFHISKILYHWRILETSTAAGGENKTYAHSAGLRAISDYYQRNGIQAEVVDGILPGCYRTHRAVTDHSLVSIIIPFKDQVDLLENCINSIIKHKTDIKYEILLISNNSTEQQTFDYLNAITKKHPNIIFLEYNVPFNYSKINNWAVNQSKGKFILLLNNDVEIISPDWLSEMVSHAQRNEVGAVGARLLYEDGTLQHAGVIIGLGGVAGHSHKYFPRDSHGYFGRLSMVSDYSACTAACLMVRREIFDLVGGLNENDLTIAFNDVDFCLKIRKAGYLIVYTPFAELFHYESKSRGAEDTHEKIARFQSEITYMHNTWKTHIQPDPYYNINLTTCKEDFSLQI